MSFVDVFNGETLPPSEYKYQALALTASITCFWSYDYTGTSPVLAKINALTSTGAWNITLPDATLVSTGEDMLFENKSAFTITILASDASTVCTIAAGVSKYVVLADNTTTVGGWDVFTYGTGTSAADASALAGYGTKATGGTLSTAVPMTLSAVGLTVDATTGRAQGYAFTGGSVACTLPLAATAGTDFYFYVKNAGTGTITLTPVGGNLVDGSATYGMNPQESCIVACSGSGWYTIGMGRSTIYQFTKLVKDLTGISSYTLTSADASNKLIQFTGAPSANTTITVPNIVSIYYTQISTSNAYTVLVKTSAGVGITLNPNDRSILYCDGVNVVNAQTASTPATQTVITNDVTTNASMYPTWVTANTGNLPSYVSSTKYSFNPSTGILTASGGFSGPSFALKSATTTVDVSAATAPSSGQVLTASDSTHATWVSPIVAITSLSVASSNGLAGSSSGGTTPILTLSTSITGMLKGNGTAISAATPGIDYSSPGATTITGILKGNGATISAATPGVDYAVPSSVPSYGLILATTVNSAPYL